VLEPAPSRRARRGASPGAARQAEHRRRERDDVRCIYVPVHRTVIETLIDRGLPAAEAMDAKAIGRELGAVLLQWVARWRQERNIP
jgi:hypothetical protein